MQEEIKIAIVLSLLENGSNLNKANEFIDVLEEGIRLKEQDSIQLYDLFEDKLKNYPNSTNVGKMIRVLADISKIKNKIEKLEKIKILRDFLKTDISDNELHARVLLKTFIDKYK